jgi:IS5 family transposase
MTQLSFGDLDLRRKRKPTRREKFLAEMDQVVPWDGLLGLIEPHYPKGGNGRPPYPLATMLRIHLMQNWFGYSDPAMEEALYEVTPVRRFARLSAMDALPDETTILNFRRLLERHALAPKLFEAVKAHLERHGLLLREGTIVDATIIHAPSSTKNQDKARDPEMHQTKKGNQYYFGMKAHIGADAESGLVHTVTTTAANVADVAQAAELLHGRETYAYADAGYTGVAKREEIVGDKRKSRVEWCVADKRGKLKALPPRQREQARQVERLKAQIRAKVEHPFRVIKRQFGYVKVRFRGLAKNTAQIVTLFALSNLWMVRRSLLVKTGKLRPQLAW